MLKKLSNYFISVIFTVVELAVPAKVKYLVGGIH